MDECLFWGVFIMHLQCSYWPWCIGWAIYESNIYWSITTLKVYGKQNLVKKDAFIPWGGGVLPYFGYLRMCGPYGLVFEKLCTYDGYFLGHPSTYHGYLFGNFTSTWGKKWQFSFKMTQFLPIMGGFYANFAPMMGAFFAICRGGRSRRGPHM